MSVTTVRSLQLRAPSVRMPIDIEALVQWAMEETSAKHLPWRNPSPRALAMDHGWTCIPKGVSREYHGAEVVLRVGTDHDAITVVEAIKALDDPAVAAQIIACGRGNLRPECHLNVEPRRVEKIVSWRKAAKKKKGNKKNRKPVRTSVWEPCSPEAICAARDAYKRWHDGLTNLARVLDGQLSRWKVTGLRASAKPWEEANKKVLDLANSPVSLAARQG